MMGLVLLESHNEKRAGRWLVWLDPDAAADAGQDASRTPPTGQADAAADSPLITQLRDEVAYLRATLATRDEEIRRRDHLLAGLIERVPELPATSGQDAARSGKNSPPSDVPSEEGAPPFEPVSATAEYERITQGMTLLSGHGPGRAAG